MEASVIPETMLATEASIIATKLFRYATTSPPAMLVIARDPRDWVRFIAASVQREARRRGDYRSHRLSANARTKLPDHALAVVPRIREN